MSAAFALWHPFSSEDHMEYTVDVRPLEDLLLNQGSQGLVQQLLSCVGVNADPVSWMVRPIRAAYYADDPTAEDWRDRWPLVYRVNVVCREPGSPLPRPFFLGPRECDVIDPTALADAADDAPTVTGEPFCLIWDACEREWERISSELDAFLPEGCRPLEPLALTRSILETRTECPSLEGQEVPQEFTRALEAIRGLGGSVHWATTLLMSESGACA